jgi:hypothetical protein
MKEETFKEAAKKYGMEDYSGVNFNDYNPQMKLNYARLSVAFANGAKWQAERMYSEEEVLQLLLKLPLAESYDNLYEWFEQFKKK